MTTRLATIDLVTHRPIDDAFILVLVEEGPWHDGDVEGQLRRLQNRLCDYLDIAVDGHLAAKFPQSQGKAVVFRLNCYGTPDAPVRDFFAAFTARVAESPGMQQALKTKGFVARVGFEYHWHPLTG